MSRRRPGEDSKPGPKTPEGAAKALANLVPAGGTYRHGVSRFLDRAIAPSCDRCVGKEGCEFVVPGGTCALAEALQAQSIAEIMALPQVQSEDLPLAREYAKCATALAVIDSYLGVTSPFLPGSASGYLEGQPILATRARLSASLVRLASELGLSPVSRARLKASASAPTSALAQAFADLEREQAARTVDADFEAEAGGEIPHVDPDADDPIGGDV